VQAGISGSPTAHGGEAIERAAQDDNESAWPILRNSRAPRGRDPRLIVIILRGASMASPPWPVGDPIMPACTVRSR